MKNVTIVVLVALLAIVMVEYKNAVNRQEEQKNKLCARFAELTLGEPQAVEITCRQQGAVTAIRVVRVGEHHESGPGYEKMWWTTDGYEYTIDGEKTIHTEY